MFSKQPSPADDDVPKTKPDVAETAPPPPNYRYEVTDTKSEVAAFNESQRKKPGVPDAMVDFVAQQLGEIQGDNEMVTLRAQGGVVHGGAHAIWAHNFDIQHLTSNRKKPAA